MADRSTRATCDTNDVTGHTPVDIGSLVVQHHRDVYRYAYRLSGNQPDAEDLSQQTFLIAHQRLDQLRDPDKAAAWLFAILRSCYLKSQRRRRPVTAASLELDVESIPDIVSEEEIDSDLLQSAIDELPDDNKLVLVMFYFEECSYKEIAAKLSIPIGTVMSRLARAKNRLRGRLFRPEGSQEDTPARRSPSDASSGSSLAAGNTRHRTGR